MKGLAYEEIVLGKDASVVSVRAITGKVTAPQVFIGSRYRRQRRAGSLFGSTLIFPISR